MSSTIHLSRRDFLYGAVATGGMAGALPFAGCFSPVGAQSRPVPSKAQLAWHEQELGMFFHYDIILWKQSWKWRSFRDFPSPRLYNPSKLDTDQWMEAAKAMGAKYVVLTAKHCTGFLQWQTDLYDYGVRQSPWRNGKGDLVRMFVDSARRYGLKPGLYASVAANGYLNVDNPGLVGRGKGDPFGEEQKRYARICEAMVTELWTRYGDLFEIWFDGGVLSPSEGGPDLFPLLEKYQPNAIAFQGPEGGKNNIRWIGNERGVAPYPCWGSTNALTAEAGDRELLLCGHPDGRHYAPGECDLPIRNHAWMWGENEGRWRYWTDRELLDRYYWSVGRNCNLLVNANPAPDGLIIEREMEIYRRFGKMIGGLFTHPLGKTSGRGDSVTLDFGRTVPVNQVVLMEDITRGDVIREFVVEGETAEGGWKTLLTGSCVGHKFIGNFDRTAVRRLRLAVRASAGEPEVREFSAYDQTVTC